MQTGSEIIVLKIELEAFKELYNNGLIDLKSSSFELKEVTIHNEEFPNDPLWNKLKAESLKAFKALKEHEFKLRHNER